MQGRKTNRKRSRRKFLQLAGGALVIAGSAVAVVRTRGYAISAEREAALVALEPWQLVLVDSLARRICAPDNPEDTSILTADAANVSGFVDAYVAEMPAALRRDLLRFFGYIEHLAPLRLRLLTRFTKLPAFDQDRVLSSIEASDETLLRGGFAGLKSLIFMGYYRDPRSWQILGYKGPFVGRPERGFW